MHRQAQKKKTLENVWNEAQIVSLVYLGTSGGRHRWKKDVKQ